MIPDKIQALLLPLYAAASSQEEWHSVLERVADAVNGQECAFIVRSREHPLLVETATRVYGNDSLRLYASHYGALDPSRQFVESHSLPGVVHSCVDHVPQEQVDKSEYFQDFLLPLGGRWVMGVKLFEDKGLIGSFGIHRGSGKGAFEKHDLRLLEALFPHIRQASLLHLQLRSLEARAERAEAALDTSVAPLIIVDTNSKVLQANRVAETLLRTGDGLTVRNGSLTACGKQEAVQLRVFILQAVAAARGRHIGTPVTGLQISRDSGKTPLIIRVLPLPIEATHRFALSAPAALVIVTDPDVSPRPHEQLLQDIYKLTAAEARVAVQLAMGSDPKQISENFGVSITTLRSQISSILSKTGANRQIDLIRLLTQIGDRGK